MKFVKVSLILSFFLLPVFAWGVPGLTVGVMLLLLNKMARIALIPDELALWPVAIVSGLALAQILNTVFPAFGIWIWLIPLCYWLVIHIIRQPKKIVK